MANIITKKDELKYIHSNLVADGHLLFANKILKTLLVGKSLFISDGSLMWESGRVMDVADIVGYSNRRYGMELYGVEQ